MSGVSGEIVRCAERHLLARTAWDEPPELFGVYVEHGRARLVPAQLPGYIWTSQRPAVVLHRVANRARNMASLLQSLVPAGLYGMAFRCETWAVDSTPGDPDQWARDAADSKAHRLHLRPDRYEERFMHIVDRSGAMHVVMLKRGDAVCRSAANADMRGAIPEALDAILVAMLGVTLPQRPTEDDK